VTFPPFKTVFLTVPSSSSAGGAADAAICEECSFLAHNFVSVKFFHSSSDNSVAHMLALPDFIVGHLANNVSLSANK
jgi:hypothetical protein